MLPKFNEAKKNRIFSCMYFVVERSECMQIMVDFNSVQARDKFSYVDALICEWVYTELQRNKPSEQDLVS